MKSSLVIRKSSFLTPHSSFVNHQSSIVNRQSSLVIRKSSIVNRHSLLLLCLCHSFFLFYIHQNGFAQRLTFYQHIQPILAKHCLRCHHSGGTAPFSLESYESVDNRSKLISQVVEADYMPPWLADTSFRHFANEMVMNTVEKTTLLSWLKSARPRGKKLVSKVPTSSPTLDTRDNVEFKFVEPFTIPGNNTEQFRIFVIPSGIKEDRWVDRIEYLPGNKKLAHHARIMIDTTQKLRKDNGIEVGDSSEFLRLGVKLKDQFWHGWVPGNQGVKFPSGTAKKLSAGADFIINMHYAPTPVEQTDLTRFRIHFVSKPDREVKTFILDENWVTNKPFFITPDTVIQFFMRSPLIPYDISLLNVLPHMHLLGSSFKSYVITPDGDFIPLIHIPVWNFRWQMAYEFGQMVKIPKGSVIYVEAIYDNTSKNPQNPYSPSQSIKQGWGTRDEMFNVIFQYLDYKPGDENLKPE